MNRQPKSTTEPKPTFWKNLIDKVSPKKIATSFIVGASALTLSACENNNTPPPTTEPSVSAPVTPGNTETPTTNPSETPPATADTIMSPSPEVFAGVDYQKTEFYLSLNDANKAKVEEALKTPINKYSELKYDERGLTTTVLTQAYLPGYKTLADKIIGVNGLPVNEYEVNKNIDAGFRPFSDTLDPAISYDTMSGPFTQFAIALAMASTGDNDLYLKAQQLVYGVFGQSKEVGLEDVASVILQQLKDSYESKSNIAGPLLGYRTVGCEEIKANTHYPDANGVPGKGSVKSTLCPAVFMDYFYNPGTHVGEYENADQTYIAGLGSNGIIVEESEIPNRSGPNDFSTVVVKYIGF